ncbi:uncharacterized membrane protein YcaP (DUF421 family) [Sphingomonas insulae]|uniref:DUF421 domain-containing protein n=1 Tax=Sphingomonas insulae TaxID=424800 RepID=A0ABN1HZG0_9SPHN|nr:YetF domain-containing protein [Sphingomonas insulae]NIJ31038.1 uncharacterized membrane protein YcaP (DUF421 family) [Sphingomonas insulae]
MFTGSLFGLVRILIVGPLAYLSLIAVLRVSGKRTLAKMNAFDFVVTVALGSTLATVLLSKDVPLDEGVLAFVILAALQFVIAWIAQRVSPVEAAIKSSPRTLLCDGQFDEAALLDERVTRDEVAAAVRKSGGGDLGRIAAVVLETDGSISVIATSAAGDRSAFPR